MREINYIVFHCTATPQNTTVESILKFWKEANKWTKPGYHWIIKADGEIVRLHPIEDPSNGVKGYNANSIHIAYIGGKKGDDRTKAQKLSMLELLIQMKKKFPDAEFRGHRDFPNVSKQCPSFSVKDWIDCIGL